MVLRRSLCKCNRETPKLPSHLHNTIHYVAEWWIQAKPGSTARMMVEAPALPV
jgi:hypothetical protein